MNHASPTRERRQEVRRLDIGSYVMGIDNLEDLKARLAQPIG